MRPWQEKRGNACISVSASVSRIPHIASDVAEIVENKEGKIGSAPRLTSPAQTKPRKNNVQTKT
jgi:hypothetical protein